LAEWLPQRWEPTLDAPTRVGRQGGRYEAYLPDPLDGRPLALGREISARAADVEAAVQRLTLAPESRSLEGLARFLLRSEAIASSRIEGMQVSPQQVALAELSLTEHLTGTSFSRSAQFVANNITILRTAATDLADAAAVTVAGVDGLHRALLPDERHHGLRTVQNWIGGNDWNPIGAEFVPPPANHVGALMDDLVSYASGGVHAPLVQAALAHAQFETIHPYTDGNGRVGRALIHTVLTRRGLTPAALLPVSLVLLTRADAYMDGLTAYRYTGGPGSSAAQDGVTTWLATFLSAAEMAAEQVARFADELADLREQWTSQLSAHRTNQGVRQTPRADSAVARLAAILPEAPLVTTNTVRRMLGVSGPAAYKAVEELADAGIVVRKSIGRGTTGYLARDVFELLTFAERRLASTRWDTRQTPPARPVPALPQS
jgi:Fic family protein